MNRLKDSLKNASKKEVKKTITEMEDTLRKELSDLTKEEVIDFAMAILNPRDFGNFLSQEKAKKNPKLVKAMATFMILKLIDTN